VNSVADLQKQCQRLQVELRWLEHDCACADNATARRRLERETERARRRYERAVERLRKQEA